MRRFTNFVLGAFWGALIGAALAILLAPSSGDELRGNAVARVRSLRSEMDQAYRARRQQLEEELESLRRAKAE
jgi:gas vesicle protein